MALEKNSVKVVGVTLGLLLVLLGTSFWGDSVSLAKAIAMIAAAMILLFEVGIGKFLNTSNYRDFMTVISGSLIVLLFAGAFSALAGWSMPQWIVGAMDYVILVSGLWIAAEAIWGH